MTDAPTPPDADLAAIRAAFEAYAAAFEAYDAAAVVPHFAVPALLVRDGVPTTLDTDADVLDSVERLLDLHRAWGVETARVAGVALVEAAPAHRIARVDWRLGRRASRLRWTYTTTYVLVPDADDVAHRRRAHARRAVLISLGAELDVEVRVYLNVRD